MRKIKINLIYTQSATLNGNLNDILEWFELTEEEWDSLPQERQVELLEEYLDGEVVSLMRKNCDFEDYSVEIIE